MARYDFSRNCETRDFGDVACWLLAILGSVGMLSMMTRRGIAEHATPSHGERAAYVCCTSSQSRVQMHVASCRTACDATLASPHPSHSIPSAAAKLRTRPRPGAHVAGLHGDAVPAGAVRSGARNPRLRLRSFVIVSALSESRQPGFRLTACTNTKLARMVFENGGVD